MPRTRSRLPAIAAIALASVAATVLVATPSDAATTLVVRPDTVVVSPEGVALFDPLANDTDADPSTLTILSAPSEGSAGVQDGWLSYLQTSELTGADVFSYSVCDSPGGSCQSAFVTVELPVQPQDRIQWRESGTPVRTYSAWADGSGLEDEWEGLWLPSPDGQWEVAAEGPLRIRSRDLSIEVNTDPVAIVDAEWAPDGGGRLVVEAADTLKAGERATLGTVDIGFNPIFGLWEGVINPLSWTEESETYYVNGHDPTWADGGGVYFDEYVDPTSTPHPGIWQYFPGSAPGEFISRASGDPASSPDGRLLAYVSWEGGSYQLLVDDHASSSTVAGAAAAPPFNDPSWSQDGRFLLFRTNAGIAVWNRATNQLRLVDDTTDAARAEWTADRSDQSGWPFGGSISRIQGEPGEDRVIRSGTLGAGRRTLAASDPTYPWYSGLTASTDGSLSVWVETAYASLRRTNGSGGSAYIPTPLTPWHTQPSVSGDGSLIAYRGGTPGTPASYGIYAVAPDGTGNVRLTTSYDDWAPSVSPDGASVVFWRSNGNGTRDLMGMAADGTGVHALTMTEPDVGTPDRAAWSHDGSRLAVVASSELQIIDVTGAGATLARGNVATVTTPWVPSHPTWSPDGTAVAYVRLTWATWTPVQRIAVHRLADHREVLLPNEPGEVSDWPVWTTGDTPPLIDLRPPDTQVLTGPSGTTGSLVTFDFTGNDDQTDPNDLTFECTLDGTTWFTCTTGSYTLASGAYTLSIRAVDAAGNVDPTPATLSWTVQVPGTQTLSGTVVGPDGSGVPDVLVSAYGPTDGWVGSKSARTGADGRYTIHGLVPDAYVLRFSAPVATGLVATWSGGSPTRAAATPVVVTAAGPVTGVDASLPAGGSIIGTVVGPGAVPVVGAAVLLYRPTDRWVPSMTAVTAGDGTFSFHCVPTGSYRVRFVPPAETGLAAVWSGPAELRRDASDVVVASAGDVAVADVALVAG